MNGTEIGRATKGLNHAEISSAAEQAAKEAGRMRSEGKSYRVADGDVMHFRFAT